MKAFRVYRMKYIGGTASSCLLLQPLEEQWIENYISIYNGCFHPMREALDCSPTDFYYDREQLSGKRQNIYVLREGDHLIGSVAICENEIDDLIVNPAFQGKGYGRALLSWAVMQMQQQRIEPILLSVVDWNDRAVSLYRSFGFETVEILNIGKSTGS